MRLLTTLLLSILAGFSFGQLNASISGSSMMCMGTPNSGLTFTGSGGAAPYTFTYTVGGQPTLYTVSSTGNTASPDLSAFPPGTYVINITNISDVTLASQNLNVTWNISIMPPPTPNAGSDQTICEGSVLTLGGNGQPGWTYTWNGPNGLISPMAFPIINPVTLNSGGVYNLMVVDQYGCIGQDNVSITVIPLPSEPFIAIDSALCNNGALTMAEPSSYGPYAVFWSNGATAFINSGVPAGVYTYQLINSYGCTYNGVVSVPQSLLPAECATVSGSVNIDSNGDCLINTGDVPVQNRMIRATPGNFLASTDANGNYTLSLEPGDYTIEEIFPNNSAANACTAAYNISLPDPSAAVSGINFLDTITDDVDLSIELITTQIRPQMNALLYIIVSDQSGNGLTAGIDGWFTLPSGIELSGLNTTYTQSNDTVYFQLYSTQTAAYLQGIIFNTSLWAGATPTFYAGIETLPNESIIGNNTTIYQTVVVNSFDPNDKTTFINGIRNDSSIYLSEQSLTYLIRFQNTGTAEAIDIHIMDTISQYLDLNSFEFLGSSHPCQVYFHGRSVKFDFPGINLPDSTSNEPESHGFVLYRIRQDQSNVVGNVITNTAYIFFDFNEAVITNTTWDEIVEPSTNSLLDLNDGTILAYPNPFKNKLRVRSSELIQQTRILDLSGKELLRFDPMTDQFELELSHLNAGLYLIENTVEGKKSVIRIIKE